jgi:8-oxo-dGTP pyrophosphatase MutT (NUDIX family)
MEAGETEAQTALRELREETGLEGSLLPGHQAVIEYALSPQVRKQVVFFPGLVEGEVNLQEREVVSYKWVSPEELAKYLHPDTYAACLPLLELDIS